MPTGSIHNVEKNGLPSVIFGGRYVVDLNGDVFDRSKDVELSYSNNKISLEYNGRVFSFSRPFLIAITTRNVSVDISVIDKLDVMFEDDNEDNISPENLILKYPDGGLECPTFPGYYYVPGYSNYVISKSGRLQNLSRCEEKTFSIGSHGYYETSVVKDSCGGRAVGKHRLLALTFIPYGRMVRSQQVNHIDHHRRNNSLNNLEWVTASQNIKAAVEFGKQTGRSNVVHLKNLKTDEIRTFPTIKKCAAHLNTTSSNVHRALESRDAHRFILLQKYIAIRDGDEWPDINVLDITKSARANGSPVLAKNIQTGDVSRHPTAMAFVRYCGLSKKVITTRLAKNEQGPVGDYLFKYEDIDDDWKF